jgi:hypothetical protein
LVGVLAVTAGGTAVATGIDALSGPLDGNPAAYFLLLLALPLWDRLPSRLDRRVGAIVVVWMAVAALWYLLALGGDLAWWRGAGAFGLACLLVGWTAVIATWRLRAAASGRRPPHRR